ncbi:hypothetical protein [Geobacter sp.]|uniref:hypothetical protein n=1 Tax=Geobacter sp. TaxID=46610 RepID=UPI001AC2EEA7|nr:hypothetical protein [Geobacter sp.]CAG1771319.1 hypothetical protein BAC3_01718 [uncultured bacterium]
MSIINSQSEIKRSKRTIDLKSPMGNAYCLMAIAQDLAGQLGRRNTDEIIEQMKIGDYENLLNVFDREFGFIVDLLR